MNSVSAGYYQKFYKLKVLYHSPKGLFIWHRETWHGILVIFKNLRNSDNTVVLSIYSIAIFFFLLKEAIFVYIFTPPLSISR